MEGLAQLSHAERLAHQQFQHMVGFRNLVPYSSVIKCGALTLVAETPLNIAWLQTLVLVRRVPAGVESATLKSVSSVVTSTPGRYAYELAHTNWECDRRLQEHAEALTHRCFYLVFGSIFFELPRLPA